MSTQTVQALKNSGYLLARNVDNKNELIEMLNYIDFLAQVNVVNIGSLELPITDNKFTLTKSEVTKLFFGHLEAKKEETAKAVVPIPQNVADMIGEYLNLAKHDLLKEQRDAVRRNRRDANNHMANFHDSLANAMEKQKAIDAAKDADTAVMIGELVANLHKTNWDFHQWDSYRKRISLVSRSDIMLTHKVAEAGLDYDINCGRFRVDISLSDMRIRVRPHALCVEQEDCDVDEDNDGWNIHPNVCSDGDVCWGNAADAMITARLQGNVLKALQILDALLPNYGQPAYVDIEQFQKDINARDARLRDEAKNGKAEKEEEGDGASEEPEFIEEEDDSDAWNFETDSGGETDADTI